MGLNKTYSRFFSFKYILINSSASFVSTPQVTLHINLQLDKKVETIEGLGASDGDVVSIAIRIYCLGGVLSCARINLRKRL